MSLFTTSTQQSLSTSLNRISTTPIQPVTVPLATVTPMPKVGTFLSNLNNTLNQVVPIVGQVKTLADTLKARTTSLINSGTPSYMYAPQQQQQAQQPVASNTNKTIMIAGAIALAAFGVYVATKPKSK